jgi:hypothetical protein
VLDRGGMRRACRPHFWALIDALCSGAGPPTLEWSRRIDINSWYHGEQVKETGMSYAVLAPLAEKQKN